MTILIINNYKDPNRLTKTRQIAKAISPFPAEILHYSEINDNSKVSHEYEGVILSGSEARFEAHGQYYQSQMDLIRSVEIPLLGICYGHQLMGVAFGGTTNTYPTGFVTGLEKITVLRNDPLLQGWQKKDQLAFSEWHTDFLETLPPCFHVLGSSKTSKYEIIRHKTKPLWGVQFHPERNVDPNSKIYTPDAEIIMRNFIQIVKTWPLK